MFRANTPHNSASARRTLATALVLALATPALADNKTVEMQFSDPGNARDATVTITFTDTAKPANDPNRVRQVPVVIPANSNAEDKEQAIANELTAKGYTVDRLRGAAGVRLPNINKHVRVDFDNGGTMEHDVMSANAAVAGSMYFQGFFDPFNPQNQPAVFTAGIVTDLGALSASVTSAELNFQTEGPIICQALFDQLAPNAPALGVDLLLAGDRLEVFFDPQFSQNVGGVEWGTDSPSEGCGGSLIAGIPELRLDLDQLVAGQNTTLIVTGADPFQTVYFTYGFETGQTYIPQLDVTLDLLNPTLIGSATADPLGEATLTRLVPPQAAGLELALQAVVLDGASQVILRTVE